MLLAITGCSAASKHPQKAGVSSYERDDATLQAIPANADRDAVALAFELLARSADDSCASCARDHQRSAFEVLEERFPPGKIVRSDSLLSFQRAPQSDDELILVWGAADGSTWSTWRARHRLTLQFHTAEDHLVGIAEADMTDEGLALLCRSTPDSVALHGALEIVPFAYGDGPSFLFTPSAQRIQIQCRILELSVH
jgi:hypothetical protein